MVSVAHDVFAYHDPDHFASLLGEGLDEESSLCLAEATQWARAIYGEEILDTGEAIWSHALGMALIVSKLRLDLDARLAALFFFMPGFDATEKVEEYYGRDTSALVRGIARLRAVHPATRAAAQAGGTAPAHKGVTAEEMGAQTEVLRKMLLAMVEDIRVVLLRLASRTQSLRYFAGFPGEARIQLARETLAIYSPLANRLGVWELKWELEDLAFRFLHPEIYRRIARQLEEKRAAREGFINEAIGLLQQELTGQGIHAEVYGRPKHIYSIWNKMRQKHLDFSEVYDVRAVRVIVESVKHCYGALGVVHNLWHPIPREFDDYISQPKGNDYRSLHTAVHDADGRVLEVQIRTRDMHQHAELGVAAHWRYKEGSKSSDGYDEKIAWLRQLISWRDEVGDNADWHKHFKRAAFDETVYVMTPQGKVVDLPQGATAVDFAYRIHTDLGHRCRGVRVDGAMLPLNTPLRTGQKVEIVAAKTGGPSRDWLNPALGYIQGKSARTKVRQWFSAKALSETQAAGRALIIKEMQRLGQTNVNLEEVAQRLGLNGSDAMYVAAARGEAGQRALQAAIRGEEYVSAENGEELLPRQERTTPDTGDDTGILIVGVDKLLSQLARCCKPAPPEAVQGFVTRGKGISIHRAGCTNFEHMAAMHPERVIEAAWGERSRTHFETDIVIKAQDRYGLLRDISEVFSKEKQNVNAVQTQTRSGHATMRFSVEVEHLDALERTLIRVRKVNGVETARRV